MIQKITFSLYTMEGQSFKNSTVCNWIQNEKHGHFSDYHNIVLDYPNISHLMFTALCSGLH